MLAQGEAAGPAGCVAALQAPGAAAGGRHAQFEALLADVFHHHRSAQPAAVPAWQLQEVIAVSVMVLAGMAASCLALLRPFYKIAAIAVNNGKR